MKKNLYIGLHFVVSLLIFGGFVYVLFAFAEWNWHPATWGETARGGCSFVEVFAVFLSILLTKIKSEGL